MVELKNRMVTKSECVKQNGLNFNGSNSISEFPKTFKTRLLFHFRFGFTSPFLFSFFGVRKCETLLADSLSHSAYPYMNELKQKKKKRVRALGKT